MTAKHADPQWVKTVRILRAQVRAAWARGEEVYCRRCGGEIRPNTLFDAGHIDAHGEPTIDNAAPEHRKCNRSHGGKVGAAITNTKRTGKTSFIPLPWA